MQELLIQLIGPPSESAGCLSRTVCRFGVVQALRFSDDAACAMGLLMDDALIDKAPATLFYIPCFYIVWKTGCQSLLAMVLGYHVQERQVAICGSIRQTSQHTEQASAQFESLWCILTSEMLLFFSNWSASGGVD